MLTPSELSVCKETTADTLVKNMVLTRRMGLLSLLDT